MVVGGVTGMESPRENREFKKSKERGPQDEVDFFDESLDERAKSIALESAEAEALDAEKAEREMEALEGLYAATETAEKGITLEQQKAYSEAKQKVEKLQGELAKLEAQLADAKQAPKTFWSRIVGNKTARDLEQKITQKQNEIDEQNMVSAILTVENAMVQDQEVGRGSSKDRIKAPRAQKSGGIKGITS
ncbi:hypothetical protein COV92_01670 [Candidatus Uhrbacteria bacterium CG11_big_fil_rev_8_21_14_0_20_41_9]|nr:MAG: hypothetical protein COV92_01670 [Candidatus Uhrbacteria bacterium CG11_big_fil_rev_8_21_14_0_20_41_9]